MPEGPESRKQAEFLTYASSQGLLTEIEVLSGRYTKKSIQGLDLIQTQFPLKTVGGSAHGKFIYLLFENGATVQFTLGMSGGFLTQKTTHARVRFRFGDIDVFFTDMRNFGTIKFSQSTRELSKKLQKLGPDIMQGDVDEFIRRAQKHRGDNICKALMNQDVVAGIGNYLKAELLYALRLSPWSLLGDLDETQLRQLFQTANEIAWMSYNLGGATISTYRNSDGTKGDATRRFAVYGQTTSPTGHEIHRDLTPDGRTTHWSPNEQLQ
jgi:DNA-formamidopyrimidine glycosylase